MKKVIAIMSILLLVAFLAAPVLANRGGWGGWSRVGGYCGQIGWYSSLPENQSNELVKLEEKFTMTRQNLDMSSGPSQRSSATC